MLSARSLLLLSRHATSPIAVHISTALAALGRSAYARNEPQRFKQLGYVKALVLVALLTKGYDVLLSDADAVFLATEVRAAACASSLDGYS